jgi:hypothetical protein
VLYKIHKGKKNGHWPTRPVCADVSSLPHGLGKGVTEMLTPIQQAQPSYFRDSFVLKDILDKMRLPPMPCCLRATQPWCTQILKPLQPLKKSPSSSRTNSIPLGTMIEWHWLKPCI